MLDDSLLAKMLKGKVVLACVGNELRADDGVGPLISGLVEESPGLKVVNCGETPENYLGVIVREKPDKVVVIDAVYMGGDPGEVRAIRKDELAEGGYSTHMPTLSLFTDFVESQVETETYFIGIEPETIAFGEKMTPAVQRAARDLARRINAISGAGDAGGAGARQFPGAY